MKSYSIALGILALLFLSRVVGQIVVALYAPAFLPSMEQWYSGLLPYPVLLPTQILILIFQTTLSIQLWRGSGVFTKHRLSLGNGLKWFSFVYFLAMVARYMITMIVYPERRWFSHTIPVWFHFVLALYVYLYSRACRGLELPFRDAREN